MKKKILICGIFTLTCFPCISETIDSIFNSVPLYIFPHLSESNRLDLLDYAKYGIFEPNIETSFGGRLKVLEYSDTNITLAFNNDYHWNLQVDFTENNDTLYIITKRFMSEDDTLTFNHTYDKEWTQLK